MFTRNLPLTRDWYISRNWGADIPTPWRPEHEAAIPEPLQDWSKVEIHNRPDDDGEE